jgi:hypothetical protein
MRFAEVNFAYDKDDTNSYFYQIYFNKKGTGIIDNYNFLRRILLFQFIQIYVHMMQSVMLIPSLINY